MHAMGKYRGSPHLWGVLTKTVRLIDAQMCAGGRRISPFAANTPGGGPTVGPIDVTDVGLSA